MTTVLSDFPQVGDHFLDRYRIESILGSGGFARVYRATQTDLERDVAIKVMRPAIEAEDSTEETIAQLEQVEKRFRREAKVISKFRSPTTVVVHDYGRTEGGLLYMTLEYVDGETLKSVIRRDAPLPAKRTVAIVRQVLESLHEAHHFDVLHRDIKPQNLMVFRHLDQVDLVKVLDFGIAKVLEVDEESAAVQELTTDGTLIGTPRYMSPEQIRGDRLSPASDIYSLGLVTYEALTGMKAVPETTTMRIIAVHLDPRPIEFPTNVPLGAGLRKIVERMIAKEPADRFQSAREVLAALERWDVNEPLVTPTPAAAPPRAAAAPPPLPSPPRPRISTPTIGATLAPSLDVEEPEEDVPATVIVDTNELAESTDLEELAAPIEVPPTVEAPPPLIATNNLADYTLDAPVAPARALPLLLPVLIVAALVLVVGLAVVASMQDESEAASATNGAGEEAAVGRDAGLALEETPPPPDPDPEPDDAVAVAAEEGAEDPPEGGTEVVAEATDAGAAAPDLGVETETRVAEPSTRKKPPPPRKKPNRGFFSVERTN